MLLCVMTSWYWLLGAAANLFRGRR